MEPIADLIRARSTFVTAAFATIVLTIASAPAQSLITWTVSDIVDQTDVSLNGEPCIAVNMGPEVCEKVINGVLFQADRAYWTSKILSQGASSTSGQMYWPTWTSGGYTLTMPYHRAAPSIGPNHATDPDYNAILRGGRHSSGGSNFNSVSCSVSGLTPGNTYELQVWYGNTLPSPRTTEWGNGQGGGVGSGGIYMTQSGPHFGQVATGTFIAGGSGMQTFTNMQHPASGTILETHNACQAFQLRELTPSVLAPRATYYGEGTPGTNTQANLGGTGCSPGIAFTGHPSFGVPLMLTAENSQDVNSLAVIVIGLASTSQPLFAGTVLVDLSAVILVLTLMPQPASPYVHDHELQYPVTLPPYVGGAYYFQVLQIDPGAAGDVSMTGGMKVLIGL
jgi:hypothetical protein